MKKFLAVLLSVVMVVTSVAPAFAASENPDASKKTEYKYYMPWGTSVTAGYGMEGGYRGIQDKELSATIEAERKAKGLTQIKSGLKNQGFSTGSYADIISIRQPIAKGFMGAIEGMRTPEFMILLTGDREYGDEYTDEWLAGRCGTSRDNLVSYHPQFIDEIKKADIISLELGCNEILSTLMQKAENFLGDNGGKLPGTDIVIGGGGGGGWNWNWAKAQVEDEIAEEAAEVKAEVKAESISKAEETFEDAAETGIAADTDKEEITEEILEEVFLRAEAEEEISEADKTESVESAEEIKADEEAVEEIELAGESAEEAPAEVKAEEEIEAEDILEEVAADGEVLAADGDEQPQSNVPQQGTLEYYEYLLDIILDAQENPDDSNLAAALLAIILIALELDVDEEGVSVYSGLMDALSSGLEESLEHFTTYFDEIIDTIYALHEEEYERGEDSRTDVRHPDIIAVGTYNPMRYIIENETPDSTIGTLRQLVQGMERIAGESAGGKSAFETLFNDSSNILVDYENYFMQYESRHCDDTNYRFADISQIDVSGSYDGTHPGHEGHEYIASQIMNAINTFNTPENCSHKHKTIYVPWDQTFAGTAYTGDIVCADCGTTLLEGHTVTDTASCKHPSGSIVTVNAITATPDIQGYTGDKLCTECGHIVEKGIPVEYTGTAQKVTMASTIKEDTQYIIYCGGYAVDSRTNSGYSITTSSGWPSSTTQYIGLSGRPVAVIGNAIEGTIASDMIFTADSVNGGWAFKNNRTGKYLAAKKNSSSSSGWGGLGGSSSGSGGNLYYADGVNDNNAIWTYGSDGILTNKGSSTKLLFDTTTSYTSGSSNLFTVNNTGAFVRFVEVTENAKDACGGIRLVSFGSGLRYLVVNGQAVGVEKDASNSNANSQFVYQSISTPAKEDELTALGDNFLWDIVQADNAANGELIENGYDLKNYATGEYLTHNQSLDSNKVLTVWIGLTFSPRDEWYMEDDDENGPSLYSYATVDYADKIPYRYYLSFHEGSIQGKPAGLVAMPDFTDGSKEYWDGFYAKYDLSDMEGLEGEIADYIKELSGNYEETINRLTSQEIPRVNHGVKFYGQEIGEHHWISQGGKMVCDICGKVSGEQTPVKELVTSISISGSKNTVEETLDFDVTTSVLPLNAENSDLVWTSSDPSVAKVEATAEDGSAAKITGVSASDEPVTITVTAKDGGGATASFAVTVKPLNIYTAAVDVSGEKEVVEGEKITLTANLTCEESEVPHTTWVKNVTWSANPSSAVSLKSSAENDVYTVEVTGNATQEDPVIITASAQSDRTGAKVTKDYEITVKQDPSDPMPEDGKTYALVAGGYALTAADNTGYSSSSRWSSSTYSGLDAKAVDESKDVISQVDESMLWKFTKGENGKWTITNAKTGQVLTATYANNVSDVQVIEASDKAENDTWTYTRNGRTLTSDKAGRSLVHEQYTAEETTSDMFTVRSSGSKFKLYDVERELPEVKTYTIIWKNWDGTVLKTDTDVEEGTVPSYSGTPTRPDDDTYTYTFDGWDPTPAAAAADATYTAKFKAAEKEQEPPVVKTYTVTWENWDGTVLKTDTDVAEGTVPSYSGATPTRPEDDTNTYTFDGWYPTPAAITADATYTAKYEAKAKEQEPSTKVESVSISGLSAVTQESSIMLTVVVEPETAVVDSVVWDKSNENITITPSATDKLKASVKGVTTGTATVYVTVNGDKSATKAITINKKSTGGGSGSGSGSGSGGSGSGGGSGVSSSNSAGGPTTAASMQITWSNGYQMLGSAIASKPLSAYPAGSAIYSGTWKLNGTNWTFIKTDGQLAKGGFYLINLNNGNAAWFLFDANGIMLTGWQMVGGKWYYMIPMNNELLGACLLGPGKTPDVYEIDAEGAWTGK
ncbi:MAG: Ig-like domain-containing protein [Lachnospiraceae bacterium]|nr:Ig-like domain-containing protein [Lachnospiraceae bacterium]